MAAEKPDHQNAGLILQGRYQPIVIALMLNTTRLPFRMEARGWEALIYSGLAHCDRRAMASQTSNCDRAALIPLSPAWVAK